METFWTIVSIAFVIGLFTFPLVLLALLWRATTHARTG